MNRCSPYPAVSHRTIHQIVRSAKGFGPSKTDKQQGKQPAGGARFSGKKQEVDELMAEAMKAAKGQPARTESINGPARPIAPEEAAKGKLDIVTVKAWGSGDADKWGDLEIKTLQQNWYSSGGVPLYEQLARELQAAEAGGMAKVAGGPVPPLKLWSFKEVRYLQYLADCMHVHAALEAAMTAAAAASQPGTLMAPAAAAAAAAAAAPRDGTAAMTPSSSSGDQAAVGLGLTPQQALAGLCHAVACLVQGMASLRRSEAIGRDVQAMLSTACEGQQQRQHAKAPAPAADQTAIAYATYLTRLSSDFVAAVTPALTTTAATQEAAAAAAAAAPAAAAAAAAAAAEAQQLGGRLLAHCYVLHVVGLTGGMRFGAIAAERLQLAQRGALALYSDFGGIKDPLVELKAAVNKAGEGLQACPQCYQALLEELPKALQKASLLMSPLAHEN